MTNPIDSYKKSLMEALANLLGGYPMMFVVGMLALPLAADWIKADPLLANIAITGIYASINFTRSFLLRRLFARYGIYDGLMKLGIKLKR